VSIKKSVDNLIPSLVVEFIKKMFAESNL